MNPCRAAGLGIRHGSLDPCQLLEVGRLVLLSFALYDIAGGKLPATGVVLTRADGEHRACLLLVLLEQEAEPAKPTLLEKPKLNHRGVHHELFQGLASCVQSSNRETESLNLAAML